MPAPISATFCWPAPPAANGKWPCAPLWAPPRARLIGQLLTESALLSLIAATLGFALAALGLRALLTIAPASVPRLNEVSLNLRALLFTVAISLLSALFFGLAPALRLAGRAMPAQRGVGGTRSTRRFRNVLVVAEYALAIVLLAGAGLVVRSLASVLRVDPGFHAAGVLTVELHSPGQNDPLNPPRFHGLVEALEALPGVEAAGGISRYFQANVMQNGVTIPGGPPLDPSHSAQVNYDVIGGDYLQALGIPLLRGRYFSRKDGPDATKVVIVNDAFVRAFLPDQDPVGVSFHRTGDPTAYTIVGVVGDTRRQDITTQPIPEVLWPHAQRPWGMNLAIRTVAPPYSLANAVRTTIHRFDGNVVIAGVDDHGSTDGRTDRPAPFPDPPSRYLRGHGAGSRSDRYLRIDALFRHGTKAGDRCPNRPRRAVPGSGCEKWR